MFLDRTFSTAPIRTAISLNVDARLTDHYRIGRALHDQIVASIRRQTWESRRKDLLRFAGVVESQLAPHGTEVVVAT